MRMRVAAVLALLPMLMALLMAPPMMTSAARAEDWRNSSPEAQGISSRELAALVTFGLSNGMDSLLVARHGRIVVEAYYAPFATGMKHRINSATKSVIGTLVGMALKDGL